MKILGLEKLSLVDFDGHISATVFTGGCNFLCPFCHNGPLVLDAKSQPELPLNEVISYLKKRKGMLTGVCVTGGEPTLPPDINVLLSEIKSIGYEVKLDTNGTNPEKLAKLKNDGLIDYVAMDIKNSLDKYCLTVGIQNFDVTPVKESVKLLLSGLVPYEFRTTLVKQFHDKQDIIDICNFICGADKYFLQAYKDSDNCIEKGLSGVDEATAKEFLKIAEEKIKYANLRGY